jgi:hypothetical protein
MKYYYAYHNINIIYTLIKTHHIIASVITPHRPSNFNSQDFNNYPSITCIYITYIMLTQIITIIVTE